MRSLSEEQEQRFLEQIAAEYLPANKPAVKELFQEIFKQKQEMPPNLVKLADDLNKSSDTIRSHLSDIYKSFAEQDRDCPLKDVPPGPGKKNKSLILHNWLWSTKYKLEVESRSITPEPIWQLLLSKLRQRDSTRN